MSSKRAAIFLTALSFLFTERFFDAKKTIHLINHYFDAFSFSIVIY